MVNVINERKINNLADKLIDEYWYKFNHEKIWNYYFMPPKYISSDTWASRKQWLKIARNSVEKNLNVLSGLEIL